MESDVVRLETAESEGEWLKNFLVNIPLGMKQTHLYQCIVIVNRH